jgi:hypothetical protein
VKGAGGGQCGRGRGGGRVALHSRAMEVVEGHRGGSGDGCSGLEEEDNKHRFLECYTFVSDKRKA